VKRSVTSADIMPLADYVTERAERRKRMAEMKRSRRVEVGPFDHLLFREIIDDVAFRSTRGFTSNRARGADRRRVRATTS